MHKLMYHIRCRCRNYTVVIKQNLTLTNNFSKFKKKNLVFIIFIIEMTNKM